ncbi:hypothetical protein HC028_21275 [Planosporangium flavigriseum]|uniref:Uncharacterized protein n=1 Tax=Planosporangium flavigriseum TaxID=373681 RepID=A0A8J3LP70_9ACTN|nr:hypothetical protein [Planosporangium flavigriseum]NJC67016.1 hypothetical protein [Planosporangium flavigriseum]GIG76718.1 hypothetical protein Pfl04_51220 [Planosporangium flavigriseum]
MAQSVGSAIRRLDRRFVVAFAVVAALFIQMAHPTAAYAGGKPTADWQAAVAKIPGAAYTRDARTYVGESGDALKPHLTEKVVTKHLQPVLADLDSRYFDGSRLRGERDGDCAFDNLDELIEYLKERLAGRDLPAGPARTAHLAALVGTLIAARQLADAAIQDGAATLAPFPNGPLSGTAPPGLDKARHELDKARHEFAKVDKELAKAKPEQALKRAEEAWEHGFAVLTAVGVTYAGDHDADGVTDVHELRLGASPLVADSDGDGLSDRTEIYGLIGWTWPAKSDSDGDGIPDGAEDIDGDGVSNLDEQNRGTDPLNPDVPAGGLIFDGVRVMDGPPPTPTPTDSDGDGLTDVAEGEIETDPHNPDSDGDGLTDGREVDEEGTDPLNPDSDGDGFRDDYEVAHAEDQGLDPTRADEKVSKWSYITDFLRGLVAGDFSPRDSMAWLAGNLCSGGLSVIPVVGWILGGLADIRDTIAGLIHGDWVSAGLSILGVVPYVGDAVAIPGKAAKFVQRFTHRLAATARFVARYDKIPDSVKTLALKAILLGDYDKLITSGFSEAVLIRLAKGERTNLKLLAQAMQDANHVAGPAVPFLRNGAAGEKYLEETLLAGRAGTPQLRFETPGMPSPRSYRVLDFAEDTPGGKVGHEVKVGTRKDVAQIRQCEKDAFLRGDGQLVGLHWHFLPNGKYNSLGPIEELLDCLRSKRIPFTIHPPVA